nr:hypothetical protein [Fodinicola feengrottensis]
MRQPTPAAITHVLDDARQRSTALPRQHQPAGDRLPRVAGEAYVEDVDQPQRRLDRREGGIQGVRAGLRESAAPELGQVTRNVEFGSVAAQLIQRAVDR